MRMQAPMNAVMSGLINPFAPRPTRLRRPPKERATTADGDVTDAAVAATRHHRPGQGAGDHADDQSATEARYEQVHALSISFVSTVSLSDATSPSRRAARNISRHIVI